MHVHLYTIHSQWLQTSSSYLVYTVLSVLLCQGYPSGTSPCVTSACSSSVISTQKGVACQENCAGGHAALVAHSNTTGAEYCSRYNVDGSHARQTGPSEYCAPSCAYGKLWQSECARCQLCSKTIGDTKKVYSGLRYNPSIIAAQSPSFTFCRHWGLLTSSS